MNQHAHPDAGATRSGGQPFTLIELLVVISIIAILASLLLPALATARESARTIKCLSQQKQLGLGFLMYADANGDRLPQQEGPSQGLPVWFTALDPYLTASESPGRSPLLQCPSAYNGKGRSERYARQMATNSNIIRREAWSKPVASKLVGEIPRPSDVMMVADASIEFPWGDCWTWFDNPGNIGATKGWFYGDSNYSGTNPDQVLGGFLDGDATLGTTSIGSHPRFRHKDDRYGNWMFVDGHAASMRMLDICARNTYSKNW